MLRSTFVFLVALAASVSCYQCNGTTNIEMPSDISQPTFYPAGWTDDQPVPKVDIPQACIMKVNIPDGYYVTVTFFKQFGTSAGVYALFSNYKTELLADNDPYPYIFTSPYFRINLSTDPRSGQTDSAFAFRMVWSKYPQLQKNIVNIIKGNPPVAVTPNSKLTTFVGDANSMISLMPFSLMDPSMNYLLRQTAIFNGDSTGDFIGTLNTVAYSKQKLTSFQSKMSVYTFGLDQIIDYPLFMAQNYQDARLMMQYHGVNCPSTGNCNVTLDGTWGTSLVVTDYNGSEFVKGFDVFHDTSIINIYENSVSNTTRIASLTYSNYKQQLPLEVKGTMKFYEILGNEVCQMVVTRDSSRASRL